MKNPLPFAIIITVLMTSCTSEPKSASFKNKVVQTDRYETNITVNYDLAQDKNDLSTTINANIEQAIVSNLSSSPEQLTLETILDNFNSEYLEFKKEFSETDEPVWELHVESELLYQSEAIITISINTYKFEGGAHGNDSISFLNLDARTGAVLEHNAFLELNKEFETLVSSYFKKTLDTKENALEFEDYFFGESFHLPANIGFSNDGLVLLYNVYEVASYDQGYIEFVIPFQDASPFLKLN